MPGMALLLALMIMIAAAGTRALVTFSRKSRATQQAVCLSNLKSLTTATLTYANDWDGRLPPRPARLIFEQLDAGKVPTADLARYLSPDDWRRRINYINDNVFLCPTTRSLYSYEFNANLYGLRVHALLKPGYTPLEYDAGFATGAPPAPHREWNVAGYNTAYCDGHALWMPGAFRHGAWESLTLTGR